MIKTEDIGEVRKFHLARTLLARGWYFTTAYWVDGLLIDTGCLYTIDELVRAARDLRIDCIVNTHSHEDHVGANAALQDTRRAPVLAHPKALHILSDPSVNGLRPYQRLLWGLPPACHGKPVGDFLETEHHRFHVVHTPGHTPDHICLFEPTQGWLFVGDTYIGGQDQALRADYNIWEIISSLKKLEALKPSVLFPGSGTVRQEATEELARKIAYLEETGKKVLDLHHKGWSTRRIRRKVLGSDWKLNWLTLGHFNAMHLVRSYIEDQSATAEGL
jgi:glyoxylase-like metal-dependent hydrolase (beta-lactamase superfamily II)